jgi:hypothetical protein
MIDRARSLVLAAALLGISAAGAEPVTYTVDAQRSNVHWRVYKAGTLSRLGHNHVISVGPMTGSIVLDEAERTVRWSLEIPVAELVVDNPELRALYGEEFASEPSEKDIDGTRTNMLSDKVLDGEHFSAIRLEGSGYPEDLGAATLAVTVGLLGREVALSIPASIAVDADGLTATGSFSLVHEDLGMKPFSVMLGALQVAENLDFTFEIRAERGQ